MDVAATSDWGVLVLRGGASGATVLRYLPDGTLDLGFGVGGEALVPTPLDCVATSFCDYGTVTPLDDGGVLVSVGHPVTIAKLDGTGALDPLYGLGGTVEPGLGFRVYGASVAPDGSAWHVGSHSDGYGQIGDLFKLDVVGTEDLPLTTVPLPGLFSYVRAAASVQAGGIILAGSVYPGGADGAEALIRVDANGILDTSFGVGGVLSPFPIGYESGWYSAATTAGNGVVVAAGNSVRTSPILVTAVSVP